MSDDLIKRDDALATIDTFKRNFEQPWKVQFSADIAALPAIDPAAIRETALREAAEVAVIHYYSAGAAMRPEFMPTRFRDAILALIGETK